MQKLKLYQTCVRQQYVCGRHKHGPSASITASLPTERRSRLVFLLGTVQDEASGDFPLSVQAGTASVPFN